MRKAILAFAFVSFAIVACFPQGQCSGSFVDYCGPGDGTCQGHIVDANHWISGPIEGTWLDFSREKTILMHFRDAKTGATLSGLVTWTDVAVSVSSTLAQSPNQYVPCAGNLCEADPQADDAGIASAIFVKNDTCSDYFTYVYVTLDPATATISGGTSDAGTD